MDSPSIAGLGGLSGLSGGLGGLSGEWAMLVLLVAACLFMLLVGVIIGFYIESFVLMAGLGGLKRGRGSRNRSSGGSSSGGSSSGSGSRGGSSTGGKGGNASKAGTEMSEEELLLETRPAVVPNHIAVIMDGNRRFGKAVHSDPLQGHWAGGQTLVDFVQWCKEDGVKIVTVYAFSTENWSRDPLEVQTLMAIFAKYAHTFKAEALSHDVRVNVLSTERDRLPTDVLQAVDELQRATSHCHSFTVNICLSYGSRGDIVNACRSVAACVKGGDFAPDEIDEKMISDRLSTGGGADPDLLIRTSGEYRLSNFLLWQMAYTELFFVDKLWPQLTRADYRSILHQYASRTRRFGT
eukprot:CAMPEP_0173182272 /NCGR_PEP_ID=MMETSP1141-20130122/7741_1 /TAXON_ID=483371 /ORGANISM="non described non described, Strain CCMP2298" /LENGTH=350 /DNA_ID=CAMNT_0014105339 /DNA_START=187 /DNA_END=1239 /DNA_ORIENTATION=+